MIEVFSGTGSAAIARSREPRSDPMSIPEKENKNPEKTLCDIAEEGKIDDEYKELVRDGKFVCTSCGRVAAKGKNLCNPTSL
ncbi:MAG: hypothetical protein ACE5OZ_12135 [Candidatus Heimdallarchaeota archaeon]